MTAPLNASDFSDAPGVDLDHCGICSRKLAAPQVLYGARTCWHCHRTGKFRDRAEGNMRRFVFVSECATCKRRFAHAHRDRKYCGWRCEPWARRAK